jgi:hypothetical protein
VEEPITIAEVHALLDRVLPIRANRFSLELSQHGGDPVLECGGSICMVVLLVIWDDQQSIRDIKEQQVEIVRGRDRQARAKLEAYLTGWSQAVRVVFERSQQVESSMPHELVSPPLLGLKKPIDAADFEAAALAKGRLGKWIA